MHPGFTQIDTPSHGIDAMIVVIIVVIVTVVLQCLNSWHTALDWFVQTREILQKSSKSQVSQHLISKQGIYNGYKPLARMTQVI